MSKRLLKRLSHSFSRPPQNIRGFHGNRLVGRNKHSLAPMLFRDFKLLSTRNSSSHGSFTSARESWTMPFWFLSKSLNISETPEKEASWSGLFLGFGTSENCLWTTHTKLQVPFPSRRRLSPGTSSQSELLWLQVSPRLNEKTNLSAEMVPLALHLQTLIRNWKFFDKWVVDSPVPQLHLWPTDFAPKASNLALSQWKECPSL